MYKNTVRLPKTTFSLGIKNTSIVREKEIESVCNFNDIWSKLIKNRKIFTLLDGPPYANGPVHIGHALNKILKDVTLRFKYLCGYSLDYKPGWDCHGMPIEHKVIQQLDNYNEYLVREKSRKLANDSIMLQSTSIQNWGMLHDYKEKYLTMSEPYRISEIKAFYKLINKNLVSQKNMPVHWSPTSKSALSDSELIYNENHVSNSAYVAFKLDTSDNLNYLSKYPIFALIWTTTIWTLHNNEAIMFNEKIKYSLFESSSLRKTFLVCDCFSNALETLVGSCKKINTFDGSKLFHSRYINKLDSKILPFLDSTHVTLEKGTGLVHASPNHGIEDFQVFFNKNIKPNPCFVGTSGEILKSNGGLTGEVVLTQELDDKLITLYGDDIIKIEPYKHSYPYDWRTNKPVIFRNCKQWFFDIEKVKPKVFNLLDQVSIIPNVYRNQMEATIRSKSYWCISRQRAWGVPIPMFYKNGIPIISKELQSKTIEFFEMTGVENWWKSYTQLHLQQSQNCLEGALKETDVFDIWFDSGLVNFIVKNGNTSDVCIEGIDQIGAWFLTSMFLNVALVDKIPFRNICVHGFVVDGNKSKMSKSIGNTICPEEIIVGGEKIHLNPSYGVDVLRYWAVSNPHDAQIQLSKDKLDYCVSKIFKIRNSVKFIIGNLNKHRQKNEKSKIGFLDDYIKCSMDETYNQVWNYYHNFKYDQGLNAIDYFITNDLSAIYFTAIKDRLYCDDDDSDRLHSTKLTLIYILKKLTILTSPVLPYLAEEINSNLNKILGKKKCSFLLNPIYDKGLKSKNNRVKLEDNKEIQTLLKIRKSFYLHIQTKRPKKFDLIYTTNNESQQLQDIVNNHASDITDLFQCNSFNLTIKSLNQSLEIPLDETLQKSDSIELEHGNLIIRETSTKLCERCRNYKRQKNTNLCKRCFGIINIPSSEEYIQQYTN